MRDQGTANRPLTQLLSLQLRGALRIELLVGKMGKIARLTDLLTIDYLALHVVQLGDCSFLVVELDLHTMSAVSEASV